MRGRALLAVGLVVLVAGCYVAPLGPSTTESRSVALAGAQRVETRIDLGAGSLSLDGQGQGLLEGNFTANDPVLMPNISYEVRDGVGLLALNQGEARPRIFLGPVRSEWTIHFGPVAPMTLTVRHGAGTASLDARGLDLRALQVEAGAGTTTIDARDVANLTSLRASTGAGTLSLDLRGARSTNLSLSVDSGAGTVTVRLPTGANIDAGASTGAGRVVTSGLTKVGDRYVGASSAWPTTITLDAHAGAGTVTLDASGG